jgi:ubiquinone/menaquinone biosynthesis C-methylase UbiE
MHAFGRRLHRAPGQAPAAQTNGLILTGGWRYDLHGWVLDTVMFRGQGRQLRQRAIERAGLEPGAQVLDVGCGTGTLALEAQRRLGQTGRVVGVDPSPAQIARARAKAARRHLGTEFQIGVIEHLAFPDQTFDVVLATLMLHHLPAPLKRQGLAEIARVLKPGGRLVLADFTPQRDRRGRAARFHAGGSAVPDLVALVEDAGFHRVDTEEVPPVRFSAFPGAGVVRAHKS